MSVKSIRELPIRIDAEHPVVVRNHQLVSSGRAAFKNSELKISNSSCPRIRGIAFATNASAYANGIEVLSGMHLVFTRNYFFQNTNFGLFFYGSREGEIEHVLVEDNVFRNKLRTSKAGSIGKVRTDYGLRVHGTKTLTARANLFDGYFNHAISLKERSRHALLTANQFRGCGTFCIDIGQEPDTKAGGSYIDRNSFSKFIYTLRVANNDRNARSCERQLATIGRTLLSCERVRGLR